MLAAMWPVDVLQAVARTSHAQTREWWEAFLRTGGVELFQQLRREAEEEQRLCLDLYAETLEGQPVPEPVAIMILVRTAFKALALATSVDDLLKAQGPELCRKTLD